MFLRFFAPLGAVTGKQLHVEDAGTADIVRGKVSLIQHNLDDVNRYWDEQTDGLYVGPDGKIYTRDGQLYLPPPSSQDDKKKPRRPSDRNSNMVRTTRLVLHHLFSFEVYFDRLLFCDFVLFYLICTHSLIPTIVIFIMMLFLN